MHIFERILLYAVTLTSMVLLFRAEEPFKATSQGNPAASTEIEIPSPEKAHGESPVFTIDTPSPKMADDKSDAAALSQPQTSLVLKDRRGQARLEIKLGPDDEPQVLLNDQMGREVISLKVQESGTGKIHLRHFNRQVEIGPDANGDLTLMLQGEKTEEIRLSLSAEGEAKVITKGQSPATLALTSRSDGAADFQIHRGAGTGGPLMLVQKNGEATIGIANSQREYGPVMHLFDDGLGQFSINGSGSSSGPTLIRTPDGTSVISVRHSNGQPAASMVSSPTGASVLAVTNTQGTQQASLRADKDGKVDIGVTEGEGSQPPAVKPEAQPKPPKVPQIELIRHLPEAHGPQKPTLSAIALQASPLSPK